VKTDSQADFLLPSTIDSKSVLGCGYLTTPLALHKWHYSSMPSLLLCVMATAVLTAVMSVAKTVISP